MILSKRESIGLVVLALGLIIYGISRSSRSLGPIEIGSQVEVTHGFYTNCTGEVVGQDEHGCFWINAICDGEDRGRLLFVKDFLRRTK